MHGVVAMGLREGRVFLRLDNLRKARGFVGGSPVTRRLPFVLLEKETIAER